MIAKPPGTSTKEEKHKQAGEEDKFLSQLAGVHTKNSNISSQATQCRSLVISELSAGRQPETSKSFLTFSVDTGRFGPVFLSGGRMVYVKGALRALLAQQRGQIQLLIIAPILTLSFLGLLVRSASSAVDHRAEKKKIVAELKRRLDEVNGSLPQESQTYPTDSFYPWNSSEEGYERGEYGEYGWIATLDEVVITPLVSLEDPPSFLNESELDEIAPLEQNLSQPQPPTFPFKTSYRVRNRDTLETILRGEGVAPEQVKVWSLPSRRMKRSAGCNAGSVSLLCLPKVMMRHF